MWLSIHEWVMFRVSDELSVVLVLAMDMDTVDASVFGTPVVKNLENEDPVSELEVVNMTIKCEGLTVPGHVDVVFDLARGLTDLLFNVIGKVCGKMVDCEMGREYDCGNHDPTSPATMHVVSKKEVGKMCCLCILNGRSGGWGYRDSWQRCLGRCDELALPLHSQKMCCWSAGKQVALKGFYCRWRSEPEDRLERTCTNPGRHSGRMSRVAQVVERSGGSAHILSSVLLSQTYQLVLARNGHYEHTGSAETCHMRATGEYFQTITRSFLRIRLIERWNSAACTSVHAWTLEHAIVARLVCNPPCDRWKKHGKEGWKSGWWQMTAEDVWRVLGLKLMGVQALNTGSAGGKSIVHLELMYLQRDMLHANKGWLPHP
ncbi:hypothetical protein C8Q74DRAFT_1217088 [Fomes fomentarius]|nr:hypothetical protein C8Q74DRAFT_1217085 [Fomes fomentarius]KAI0779621.1 hypothetical protein C8Q74DRAFT_1217088 [Fomes fomentarius]